MSFSVPRPKLLIAVACVLLVSIIALVTMRVQAQPLHRSLRAVKDRRKIPKSYKPITLDEMLSMEHGCPLDDETAVLEATGVSVEGYLVTAVKRSDGETYGFAADDGDIHLHLADTPSATFFGPSIVITEATPPFQHQHSDWNVDALAAYASSVGEDGFSSVHSTSHPASKVRISGWLMADNPQCKRVPWVRGTVWEVHPVTKIEVWQDYHWEEIE